ncbi:AN1-type zinc finger protein 6 [Diretmus argenteus]
MAQETNQSQGPLLCATGCGFYGSPRNNGMCSVCYKDFLQRQNSNGRISQPDSSSTDSSIGESLLAQCSDSTTVPAPTATDPTDTEPGHSSGAVTTSATPSADESTSEAKVSLKTADSESSSIPGTAAEVGSGQEGQSSPAGSSGTGSSGSTISYSKAAAILPGVQNMSGRMKRKLENIDESIDAKRASVSEDSGCASVEAEEKPKAKKKRCFTCRKKIGLTGFDCRCGNVFCSMHRYSDIHNCTFDYKAEAAEKIRKENPVIVGEKIQKI